MEEGEEQEKQGITGMLRFAAGILSVASLTGCAMFRGPVEPGGISDWVELQPGAVITNVDLPTDEAGKKYNIIVKKPSAVVSLDMLDRMGK